MAFEIRYPYFSGSALYSTVLNSSGLMWNGSAFESILSSDWTKYAVGLTEQGSCGVYVGSFPTAITASGLYTVTLYSMLGASVAATDTVVGIGQIAWSGSAEGSVLNVGGGLVTGYAAGEDPAAMLKADPRFKALLAYADCNYSYNSSTNTLTQFDKDGVSVLNTIAMSYDSNGNITGRSVSGTG